MNAAEHRPVNPYVGQYADDEDFAHVLQLGWDNFVAVLTADAEMIKKALKFERQVPKEESCLRGVIILPPGKEEQVRVLRAFEAGDICAIRTRKGDALPENIAQVEQYNIGLDLRQARPRVIHLCGCMDE